MCTFRHVSTEEVDRDSFICSSCVKTAESFSITKAGCNFSLKTDDKLLVEKENSFPCNWPEGGSLSPSCIKLEQKVPNLYF